ncbi:phenoloxidase 3-like [Drosophila rhopaloa]|uniref:Phenoloxidase 3-like n=1 Tax=Drosophila rhopaloa TaxID=1041015 RepID=A0A6P4FED8_DRORH|nr:phenoloxidase 3-like [Drosophila rhopaloa]
MPNKKDLLLLFDHPTEPVFMDKGGNGTMFEVPKSYLTEKYNLEECQIVKMRLGDDRPKVFVSEISIPDLSFPESLKRNESFSLFIQSHRQKAGYLIDIFLRLDSVEHLKSVAVYARDRMHPVLFHYAFAVALLHRPDTKDLNLRSFWQYFPDRFMDSTVLQMIREESFVMQRTEDRRPIVIPIKYTASDLEPEHNLWYFREDLGINLHHWHWHLIYPIEITPGAHHNIVKKDRRGELFYYMHQQVIARYNAERLSNNMGLVKPFNNLTEPIAEGYFPKMDSQVASRAFPPRFDNVKLTDLHRKVDQLKVGINDMNNWSRSIYEAIHHGFIINDDNESVRLDEVKGIDILGNIIESSVLSPNSMLYGDLHNMGHMLIAYAHDPTHKHLEFPGVMGDSSTAMRDPIFYKWHAYIDDLFQAHKKTLPAYKAEDLSFPGIDVLNINVKSRGQLNRLTTFFKESDVDLSRGMDFQPRGSVFTRFTHLQHHPFEYTFDVNNSSGAPLLGYARIFMAPRLDDNNSTMVLADQRLMMIELDKFLIRMPPGESTFTQKSINSSVTIPFERTFRDQDSNRPGKNTAAEQEEFFCGCGWPDHMLVPRGKVEGMTFDLFLMVSNYENERVIQPGVEGCSKSASYCGLRDRLYPDRRSMGYPFDRLPPWNVTSLNQFLTSNMKTVEVTITHDKTIETLPPLTNRNRKVD